MNIYIHTYISYVGVSYVCVIFILYIYIYNFNFSPRGSLRFLTSLLCTHRPPLLLISLTHPEASKRRKKKETLSQNLLPFFFIFYFIFFGFSDLFFIITLLGSKKQIQNHNHRQWLQSGFLVPRSLGLLLLDPQVGSSHNSKSRCFPFRILQIRTPHCHLLPLLPFLDSR